MIDGKTANEIFDSIRQHIIAGTLRAEDSLPPVRELASELKVNRNTVAAAYKRLITAGLAQSLGRNGTVIKGSPSPVALEGGDPHTPLHDLSGGNPDPQRLPDLSRYFARLSRTPHLYGDAPVSLNYTPGRRAGYEMPPPSQAKLISPAELSTPLKDCFARICCRATASRWKIPVF